MSASPASDVFVVSLPASPYPGLRPFEKHEWPIFFGRERMADEVIERLVTQQLLVVHGDSGCGKSSLIRAGVLPRLELENARGGLTWRTCTTQPRDAPLRQLAESLAALDGRAADEERITEIRRVLNFGKSAANELSRLLRRGEADHICILLDQFEELFQFAKRHGPDEARLLVQCLVGLLETPPPGLHAIVTMRSEFLGVCARFEGLAEAVNRAQYLVPRMAHADLVRAVREPARLYTGHVSIDLAERLITEAGGGQDELPLIQHGLMLLHSRKTIGDAAVYLGPSETTEALPVAWRLDVDDYQGAGNLRQLLSNHADQLAGRNEQPPFPIAEALFRALTDINVDGHAIRRPLTFARLVEETSVDEDALRRVLDVYRADGASFVTPYGDAPVEPSTLVDISHEAFMRCWSRIADPKQGWLVREFQDGLVWRSLVVQAESFRRNPSNVLSFAVAEEQVAWLDHHCPSWAVRYGGGWEAVKELVNASVDAGRATAQREQRRRRLAMFSWATLAIMSCVLAIQTKCEFIPSYKLNASVAEVSYATNQGDLYITVAFTNEGNRDAVLLRVEPTIWVRGRWVPLTEQIHPDIPVTAPRMPIDVNFRSAALVTLSVQLTPSVAESALVQQYQGAFLGLRLAAMHAGGTFMIDHPVARLSIDASGRIRSAEPAIHRSLSAFEDMSVAPPGDMLHTNKQTPFVWADRDETHQ